MSTSPLRFGLAFLGLAALCPAAFAQFQMGQPGVPNPYNAAAGANPYGGNAFFNRGFNPYNSGASMTSSYSPYGGQSFSPYVMPFVNYGPVGGAFIGQAALNNSIGQYWQQQEQARILNQQYYREKYVTTRRAMLEEWLWERNNLPTRQDEFERMQKLALRRSQNDPPLTEIIDGRSLNDLLQDIQKHLATPGPDLTLNEDILRKVNVTPAGKGVNLGVFKNDGKLSWPNSLRGGNYKRERELLDQLAKDAFAQAGKGQVDPATTNQMSDAIEKMMADLSANIRDMGPSKYIESKRFLNELKEGTRGLERNDVANFFNNKYAAKGRTVKELVTHMTQSGLKFAPYTAGNESAYLVLQRLMAAYDVAINNAVADQRQP